MKAIFNLVTAAAFIFGGPVFAEDASRYRVCTEDIAELIVLHSRKWKGTPTTDLYLAAQGLWLCDPKGFPADIRNQLGPPVEQDTVLSYAVIDYEGKKWYVLIADPDRNFSRR